MDFFTVPTITFSVLSGYRLVDVFLDLGEIIASGLIGDRRSVFRRSSAEHGEPTPRLWAQLLQIAGERMS
jgi:hypothetical protein